MRTVAWDIDADAVMGSEQPTLARDYVSYLVVVRITGLVPNEHVERWVRSTFGDVKVEEVYPELHDCPYCECDDGAGIRFEVRVAARTPREAESVVAKVQLPDIREVAA